ncbi:hypothetical protein GCM10010415_74940 [Streptomyces atrovirens]
MREAPADDHDWPRDLRTQHGLGADPVDALAWLHEGTDPDMVRPMPAQQRRAAGRDEFLFVSGPGAGDGPVFVRVIRQPLRQLTCRPGAYVTPWGSEARAAWGTGRRRRHMPSVMTLM